MPNKREHIVLGAVTGLGLGYSHSKSVVEAVVCGGIACASALLLDKLEPATNPRHRKTLHSIAFACALYSTVKGKGTLMGKGVMGGLGSHYLGDASTKMSLPRY